VRVSANRIVRQKSPRRLAGNRSDRERLTLVGPVVLQAVGASTPSSPEDTPAMARRAGWGQGRSIFAVVAKGPDGSRADSSR